MKKINKAFYPTLILKLHSGVEINPSNKTGKFLHHAYFQHRKKYFKHKAYMLVGWYNWLFKGSFQKAPKLISRNNAKVQELTGMSKTKQYVDLVTTCLTMPCKPQDYYIYNFYSKENKKHGRDYIFKYQTKSMLYRMLLSKKAQKNIGEISPLTDKNLFEKKATEEGLPIIPVICTIEKNKVYYNEKNKDYLKGSLFAKPILGRGGRDAEVWSYKKQEDKYKRKRDPKLYTFSEIIEHYLPTSEDNPMLIQKQMKNHPDLNDISGKVLSTYRVLTMIDEKENIEVVAGIIRMASRKGKVVDNFHKGGIGSAIDLETGVLGEATDLGIGIKIGYLSHHPLTQAPIKGRVVPMWKEAKELAQKAHQSFLPRVLIGWDIAITSDGPILVEGNAQPCVDIVQRVGKAPLSHMRMGELMKYHIQKNQDLS